MSAEDSKINPYSISDLKNTTDDALPNYLSSLKFTQSHFYTDVRLALGYTAVTIAGAAFYFDYTMGWEKTKYATFWAVIFYFAINSVLTYWIWGVEKGQVFAGELDGAKLSLQSSVDKHVPIYHLQVKYLLPGKSEAYTISISSPFTRWFSSDGYFVAKPFQEWLASEIPIVGRADPENAGKNRPVTKDASINDLGTVMNDIAASPARSTRGRVGKQKN